MTLLREGAKTCNQVYEVSLGAHILGVHNTQIHSLLWTIIWSAVFRFNLFWEPRLCSSKLLIWLCEPKQLWFIQSTLLNKSQLNSLPGPQHHGPFHFPLRCNTYDALSLRFEIINLNYSIAIFDLKFYKAFIRC